MIIVLQRSGFGRQVYFIGNSLEVAEYSGVRVKRVKMTLFMLSGFVAAIAGALLAARLGAVRGSTADGFELDIITMVLLGGVSIFGGSGTLTGVWIGHTHHPQHPQRPLFGQHLRQYPNRGDRSALDFVCFDPELATKGSGPTGTTAGKTGGEE